MVGGSVGKGSVVGGSVVGGFNKTQYTTMQSIFENTPQKIYTIS